MVIDQLEQLRNGRRPVGDELVLAVSDTQPTSCVWPDPFNAVALSGFVEYRAQRIFSVECFDCPHHVRDGLIDVQATIVFEHHDHASPSIGGQFRPVH